MLGADIYIYIYNYIIIYNYIYTHTYTHWYLTAIHVYIRTQVSVCFSTLVRLSICTGVGWI